MKKMYVGNICKSVSETFNKQQDSVILINTSDILLIFWDNEELITRNFINQAVKMNKHIIIHCILIIGRVAMAIIRQSAMS